MNIFYKTKRVQEEFETRMDPRTRMSSMFTSFTTTAVTVSISTSTSITESEVIAYVEIR